MNVFIDPRFAPIYQRTPLVLVDVGARGGLKKNWLAARPHLRLFGFEPEQKEVGRLAQGPEGGPNADQFFGVALHNRPGPMRLNVTRDRGLSSVFEPDREFLNAFPESDRFDFVHTQDVDADTLDSQLASRQLDDVDFVKADTQGSELYVLEGAAGTLKSSVFGVEIEAEFSPIYKGQPLFADVDRFMRGLGFVLFDLRPCYWKREAGRDIGGPHGQIIWADALYLKSLAAWRESLAPLSPDARKSKILRGISIALLYGYYDFAMEIVRTMTDALGADDARVIASAITTSGQVGTPAFPGKRQLAGVFQRLWKLCRDTNRGWSVSDADLGNLS